MASRGFQFPGTPTTSPVLFMAAPPHPYIEQGIRDFIDLIDLELGASEKVSKLCSEKWLHFPFPVEVDRSAIQSINYLSGKYRFFLSEDKILTLLTGDDLYSDDFVFVRELLQNAIDTVRHRAFIEGIKNPKFVPLPISVSFFKDAEGYHWLRMDDEGMGMSQEIIQSYLLNKGNSYYNSDLFKLERIKIREANGRDFVPISRFGIGLLSCFMTCDKIEINTCYFYENDDRSLAKNRLSIEGRGGFWVIRNDKMHHLADRMPSEKGWEKGYRDVPGTSIACRIKTARDFRGINIKDQINRYLLAPEIPVSFQGEYLGGDINELVKTPWCTSSVTTLPQEFISKCSELLNCAVENIDIDIRSISLTQKSATQNLRGQMVVVVPRIKVGNVNKYFNTGDYFRIRSDGNNATLVCEKTEKTENGQELKKEENCDITEILSNIKIPERFSEDTHGHSRFRWPRVSHNGIVVYDNDRQLEVELKQFDQFDELHRHHSFFLSTGLFWFRDELLPEVTVSRNVIKRIPDEIIAHVLFATRELNDFAGTEQLLFAFMPKIERNYNMRFTLETLEKTRLYDDHIAYWNELPCIYLKDRGVSSISVALELAKVGPIIFKTKFFNSRFYLEFTKYMILRNFHISYISNGNDDYHLQAFLAGEKNKISPELLPFQPMRFIECDQKDKIVLLDGFINRIHPLSQWFLTWFPIIEKDFYYLGMQLMNELLGSTVPDQKVGSVNEILVRLRELLPIEARPSEELNISVDSLFSENK
jgi:hypothetical protein